MVVTCIVFLNFIIAEVSNSYQIIKDTVDVIIQQERAQLINESKLMLSARFGEKRLTTWKHIFPKYIISRQEEDWVQQFRQMYGYFDINNKQFFDLNVY